MKLPIAWQQNILRTETQIPLTNRVDALIKQVQIYAKQFYPKPNKTNLVSHGGQE